MSQHIHCPFNVCVYHTVQFFHWDLPDSVVLVDGPGVVDYDVWDSFGLEDGLGKLSDVGVGADVEWDEEVVVWGGERGAEGVEFLLGPGAPDHVVPS